jgi:hypothetical protein
MTASNNVQLVRSIYAARAGRSSNPTEWADADIEFVFADGPSPGRWTGITGMREAWREFVAAWDDYRLVVDQFRELDEERVSSCSATMGAEGRPAGWTLARWAQGARVSIMSATAR